MTAYSIKAEDIKIDKKIDKIIFINKKRLLISFNHSITEYNLVEKDEKGENQWELERVENGISFNLDGLRPFDYDDTDECLLLMTH